MELIQNFIAGLSVIGTKEIGVILAVIVIDAALSCDNSIAINALALDLPEQQHNKAIWLGMSLAALLRLVALSFAAYIIKNAWVQVLGGLYLIYLCIHHFRHEKHDKEIGQKTHANLMLVLGSIGLLDLSLSLDNVVGVVALTNNYAVIAIAVLISIAMLAVATQIVRRIMQRYPALEPAAYIILAFLGINMITDHGAQFVLSLGGPFAAWHDTIAALHFRLGEVWEVVGVVSIIIATIAFEEFKRRSIPTDPTK